MQIPTGYSESAYAFEFARKCVLRGCKKSCVFGKWIFL